MGHILLHPLKGAEKILCALAEFDYLTAAQLTRLLYAPSSHAYVRKQLNGLADQSLVFVLPGRFITLPRVYTLTAKGYGALKGLGIVQRKRIRPAEERKKAHNLMFLQHTLTVSDVLIAARLLSQTHPNIVLTRMYTEHQLRRKIYVPIPESGLRWPEQVEMIRHRILCLEPDASVLFRITESWHDPPETWEDFFHIEVYRNLPPAEWRFKQKIAGYVNHVNTGRHKALFHTPALSIAVITASEQTSEQMTPTLRRWTEEALQAMERVEEGVRFFFRSIADTANASPTEMFLSPVWEQAFGTAKTPLIVLEEEQEEAQTNQ
jgi:hypothetical protein